MYIFKKHLTVKLMHCVNLDYSRFSLSDVVSNYVTNYNDLSVQSDDLV